MTPGARVAAAIEILDEILVGAAAEAVLTRWARGHRFAGSKDRAAIRDHVFDALRQLRSAAAYGGAMTGRGLMLGLCTDRGDDVDSLFNGLGYAPAPLSSTERDHIETQISLSPAQKANLSDEVWEIWKSTLGENAFPVAEIMQQRAPICVRVNTALCTRSKALGALQDAGLEVVENPISQTALTIVSGERKLKASGAFLEGWIELQDAASQAVMQEIGDVSTKRVLDYCAGGGGKSLALAARGAIVTAYDKNQSRMNDLKVRAERAKARVRAVSSSELSNEPPYDVVLCDVPCSGSGTWRRTPDAKWKFGHKELDALIPIQREICQSALSHLKPDGRFAYVTCSVFEQENGENARWLCENLGLRELKRRTYLPNAFGDGLFLALFCRG